MNDITQQYVEWFRSCSPYIHSHRGKTFVVYIGGETIASKAFAHLLNDIALLNSLGVRLVLVHGARPQIDNQLATLGLTPRIEHGWRVTSREDLAGVEQAVGQVRVQIETGLSRGLVNTPMAGASLRVVSGNFVTARPYGVHHGIDYGHTGEVRRIDTQAIRQQLDLGNIVLISPMGYSPSGEAFNCQAEDVAMHTAMSLQADKYILMVQNCSLTSSSGEPLHQLSLVEAEKVLQQPFDEFTQLHVKSALNACKHGVRRSHLISDAIDGALLLELYTRDGSGVLVTTETYDGLREATIDDVGGILELIQPMEEQGILVRRSREQLELEINHFIVIERDGMIIACAALYPFGNDVAELACLVVHDQYRDQHRGDELLAHIEKRCNMSGIDKLFLLTTQTAHWFRERGFDEIAPEDLPSEKQALYNRQRNSKVFCKKL